MIFLRIILIFLTFSPESLFSKQGSGIVLVYHRFDEQKHPSTSISSQNFNEQLQYLKKIIITSFQFLDLLTSFTMVMTYLQSLFL